MIEAESVRLYDHPDAAARRAMLNEMHRQYANATAGSVLHASSAIGDRRPTKPPQATDLDAD